ncbi:hypothetical protein GCM10023237_69030 [Streptomyces coeruleoprunus]
MTTQEIPTDRVLSVDEGMELKKRIAERRATGQRHWMGNYGSSYDVVAVASAACTPRTTSLRRAAAL